MLAFAKDITQNKPKHPEENKNNDLKEYMDYQRKLDHERLIYHSLEHSKTYLQQNIQAAMGDQEKLEEYLQKAFPLSNHFADSDTIMLMLRKMLNGHNSTNNWYRMNYYYYALAYDCLKRIIKIYNRLVRESPEKAKEYGFSEGVEIDFDDWTYLYFPDLDFHIGKKLDVTHYPFSKRNKAIEEEINKKMKNGSSHKEALENLKEKYEIDDTAIKVLLEKEVSQKDLELFYTSVENPIYEYLTPKQEGRWGLMDGESLMDHDYYLGSQLKVWVWRKREEVESIMDELEKKQKK